MVDRKQRIPPLPREEWTDEARNVFSFWGEPGAWENGSKVPKEMVMAQHPKLAIAFHTFGKHILLDSCVPERPREILVLHTACRLNGQYAWHFHVGYALQAGMTVEEVAAIRDGPDSPVWQGKEDDIACLRAVDELLDTARISDETWAALARFLDQRQLMEVVFTIGAYAMLSWSVNAFGIGFGDAIDPLGFDLKTASGKEPLVRFRPGEAADWADSGNQ
jgi:4-carboxymuconolactone decarboxylase